MRRKLRKIIIDGIDYLYIITDKYHLETETNTLNVRIYLIGQKKTPLVINFLTIDHYNSGQILKSGVNLKNDTTGTVDAVNINEPKYIRALILQGIKNGWAGINKIETQDGLNYLKELGYGTSLLNPVSPL